MWLLSNLHEYCNTPEEHHAVCSGIGDGLQPWRSDKMAQCLYKDEWHYYSVARGLASAALIAGLIWLVKR